MSNEVLNGALLGPMKFDELGALEITDPTLLSAVAAGVNSPYLNGFCGTDGVCGGDTTCFGNEYCQGDSYCMNKQCN